MKPQTLLLALVMISSSCSKDDEKPQSIEWKKLGLDGKSVNEIHLSGSNLYVATTAGLYRKGANSDDAFDLIGFENKNVEAIEIIGPETILASLYDKTGAESPAIFKSVDNAATWNEIDSNFGGQLPEPVLDFELNPANDEVIYATGLGVVAKSVNAGLEWEPIYGNWGAIATGVSAVEINPERANEIWAGGQGAIENGFLLRSTNESDWQTWSDLVDNPTVVKEITFSTENEDEVLVGFEGALLKTPDGGEHWQTLIESEQNRFYFGVCRRENDTRRVYAGGWLKTSDPQPLLLFISNDGGTSWQESPFQSESYGGILEMQIKSEGDKDILFVGLDKGGVYQVTVR